MNDVGWDLGECKANVIYIDRDDLGGTLDRIESVKLNANISTIILLLPYYSTTPYEYQDEKAIDGIAGLLKANPNIKHLKVENSGSHYAHSGASTYLLETLANGDAGNNLEYLWYDFTQLSTREADTMQKYMQMSHNLRRLRIHVEEGPASLQLISCLSDTSITDLCLEVWPSRGVGEVGTAIGQGGLILSLKIVVRGENLEEENLEEHFTDIESFIRGAAELRGLSRVEIDLQEIEEISTEMIDAIAHLAAQQGTLAHFSLATPDGYREACIESWQGLGLALRSVKRVSLRICSEEGMLSVLPQLQACESLALAYLYTAVASVLSNLTSLQAVVIDSMEYTYQDTILDIIKSSNSITNMQVRSTQRTEDFRDRIESFCILNRVFGTTLVGFGPTDLWTRVLSKVSDDSAKANFLYRLLCEKPEMIVGSM